MFRSIISLPFALAVLAVTGPLQAAPGPTDELAKIDKYLPDETVAVFVLNMKPIRESKVYAKGIEKVVNELLKTNELQWLLKEVGLKRDQVQSILNDAGLDPLNDIDRVILAKRPGREGMSAPFLVAEGRFDPDKILAAADTLSKNSGTQYKARKPYEIGKAKVFEVVYSLGFLGEGTAFVATILNKNTLIFAATTEEIEQAVEKAAGKKETEFKVEGLAKLIDKMDSKKALTVACAGEKSLIDDGIESVTASFTVTDVINAKVVVTAKDAEAAKKINAQYAEGLAELTRQFGTRKDPKPVLDVLKGIKQSRKELAITLEAQCGIDAVEAVVRALLGIAPPPLPPAAK